MNEQNYLNDKSIKLKDLSDLEREGILESGDYDYISKSYFSFLVNLDQEKNKEFVLVCIHKDEFLIYVTDKGVKGYYEIYSAIKIDSLPSADTGAVKRFIYDHFLNGQPII